VATSGDFKLAIDNGAVVRELMHCGDSKTVACEIFAVSGCLTRT
jgi:hypothetical protein